MTESDTMDAVERLDPVTGDAAGGLRRQGRVDSFTALRWITIETQPGHYPI